ncbi:AtuA-related protein [Geobacillus subterraneus]|uniref:AtuA-related protein n=1 Tax=Geobacillus TaxID=129337 RepID=UPI001FD34BBA|nr:hypothetical protein [Geobacillus subterraneus]
MFLLKKAAFQNSCFLLYRKVKDHLCDIVKGEIVRYELPNIAALQFVCHNALDGGVTTSLALDPHGKTLSYALLTMQIDLANGI